MDVGANHYERFSNTYFLEVGLGWEGIAVEPMIEFGPTTPHTGPEHDSGVLRVGRIRRAGSPVQPRQRPTCFVGRGALHDAGRRGAQARRGGPEPGRSDHHARRPARSRGRRADRLRVHGHRVLGAQGSGGLRSRAVSAGAGLRRGAPWRSVSTSSTTSPARVCGRRSLSSGRHLEPVLPRRWTTPSRLRPTDGPRARRALSASPVQLYRAHAETTFERSRSCWSACSRQQSGFAAHALVTPGLRESQLTELAPFREALRPGKKLAVAGGVADSGLLPGPAQRLLSRRRCEPLQEGQQHLLPRCRPRMGRNSRRATDRICRRLRSHRPRTRFRSFFVSDVSGQQAQLYSLGRGHDRVSSGVAEFTWDRR